MKNKIIISQINEVWNKYLAKTTFYRVGGKKFKSHQRPISNVNNNNYITYGFTFLFGKKKSIN